MSDFRHKKEKKKKLQTLTKRLTLWILLCMLVFSNFLIRYVAGTIKEMVENSYYQGASKTSAIAAGLTDGDKLWKYIQTGETDAYYEELEDTLGKIKENGGCNYLYLFHPEDGYFTYIIDAQSQDDDENNISCLGDRYDYGDMEKEYLVEDVKNKAASSQIIYGADVGYGKTISAWAPILDSNGNLVAMAEADYTMPSISAQVLETSVKLGAIMGGITLVLALSLLAFSLIRITNPIRELTKLVTSYKAGEGKPEIQAIRTNDEIEILYHAFGKMMDKTEQSIQDVQRVTAEKERIGAELDIATKIQKELLPQIFPPFPDRKDMDIYAVMDPAKEVGGDLYDFFMIGESKIAIVIADVSGKGIPAALFMAITKTLIKNRISNGETASQAFEGINNQLCEGNGEGFFVTAWAGILDLTTGEMEYANAGHNPPVLIRKNGEIEWVHGPSGLVLAAMEDMTYTPGYLKLEKGDKILLYTDGVTEANNMQEEMFGEVRLEKVLAEYAHVPVQESIAQVMLALNAFVGAAEQFDDITMLELEYK